MTKTFWSVQYSVWGADRPRTAWFDNADKAKDFASRDYRDNPVRHTYKKPEKIRQAQDLVSLTSF